MKVGDLIQCLDGFGAAYDSGLICKIEYVIVEEHFEDAEAIEQARYWAAWHDGQYAWVTEDDEPEVISESG